MLRRDFTKSNKEYFKKNKFVLIAVTVFLVVGIILFAVLGMNGNFEVSGYNEFSVTVGQSKVDDLGEHTSEICKIIDSYNGKFDTVLVHGEGDDTQFVVRYLNDLNNKDVLEINQLVADHLGVGIENITEHVHVGGTVRDIDYVYTATSILILIVIASIFAYVRYNGASAMSIIISCLLGTLGFISMGSILRLSVGLSYFAMLVILNMLIIYFSIDLFESMHKSSWLKADDFSTALETGMQSSKFRSTFFNLALLVIGLMMVMIAPITIKYVALNLMFMSVVTLATIWYVVPFVWSVFITHCRKRDFKIKTTNTKTKK